MFASEIPQMYYSRMVEIGPNQLVEYVFNLVQEKTDIKILQYYQVRL